MDVVHRRGALADGGGHALGRSAPHVADREHSGHARLEATSLSAVADLLARATRGSRASKALGKRTLYAQLDRPEADAYTLAREVMAAASQLPGAREGMTAFLEKRPAVWPD